MAEVHRPADAGTPTQRIPSLPDRTVSIYHEYEHGPKGYGRLSAAVKRVSWGAIFAGAVIAVVTGLVLNLLGLGIGLNSFDPATEGDSVRGLGIGQGIWIVLSSLASLFVGGWVAGRLAGMPRKLDGSLHGLVVWGLTTLITVYLLTSAVGRIVSGVGGLLGAGLGAAGGAVAAVAPPAADAVQGQLQERGINFDTIAEEARQLLRDTGDPQLQPGALEDQAEAAADEAQGAAADAAQTPADGRAELDNALDRVLNRAEGVASEADREDLVNVLVARTDMSEAEARQTVAQWEGRLGRARQQAGAAVDTLQERAPEVAENATDAVGTGALWAAFALGLGALAAAFGGRTGAPEDLPADATARG